MQSKDNLGEFEQIVLLALMRLGENAYGTPIREEISERTGRDVSVGALYTTLDRLEQKGFILSRQGNPTRERGGRAKKYFRISAPGERALKRSRQVLDRMWEGLPLPEPEGAFQ